MIVKRLANKDSNVVLDEGDIDIYSLHHRDSKEAYLLDKMLRLFGYERNAYIPSEYTQFNRFDVDTHIFSGRKIQVISNDSHDMWEVVRNFDISVSANYFNGKDLDCNSYKDIIEGDIVICGEHNMTIKRVNKYIRYGILSCDREKRVVPHRYFRREYIKLFRREYIKPFRFIKNADVPENETVDRLDAAKSIEEIYKIIADVTDSKEKDMFVEMAEVFTSGGAWDLSIMMTDDGLIFTKPLLQALGNLTISDYDICRRRGTYALMLSRVPVKILSGIKDNRKELHKLLFEIKHVRLLIDSGVITVKEIIEEYVLRKKSGYQPVDAKYLGMKPVDRLEMWLTNVNDLVTEEVLAELDAESANIVRAVMNSIPTRNVKCLGEPEWSCFESKDKL